MRKIKGHWFRKPVRQGMGRSVSYTHLFAMIDDIMAGNMARAQIAAKTLVLSLIHI